MCVCVKIGICTSKVDFGVHFSFNLMAVKRVPSLKDAQVAVRKRGWCGCVWFNHSPTPTNSEHQRRILDEKSLVQVSVGWLHVLRGVDPPLFVVNG